jgi:hypothetical protein
MRRVRRTRMRKKNEGIRGRRREGMKRRKDKRKRSRKKRCTKMKKRNASIPDP